MENKRPTAYLENREYFYSLVGKSPTEVQVNLYSTNYILVKDKDGIWTNHHSNKNVMSKGLIEAVILAVEQS